MAGKSIDHEARIRSALQRYIGADLDLYFARIDFKNSSYHVRSIEFDLDAKIHEIARTGSCELLQQLRRSVPRGTATLLHVPGLGPKKVHALGQGLGVHSPTDLVNALKSGRLSELRGFGPKTEDRLREALGAHRGKKQRVPLAVAEREAGPLVAYMRSNPAVRETVVAGSLRRKRDSVGDIDLLVVSDRGPAVARHFVAYPAFREVLAQGAKRASAVLASGLQVDLRVVPAESYGAALMYFTGSKAYNIELRRRAIARGLKLNEYGLFKGERRIAGATEESIYAALDLPWLAPEKREIDIA
ncbi:MAG TPA: helix-hairpin-helix domain-containing protein, partial [Burkholderiaceae bacterium]|nr:helix-hairpin-helix domain-containing protein [Burkholderiaceae bacterium]